MAGPDVYPEMILDAAQEKIRVLAREQARRRARRASPWLRCGLASWLRKR